jgi:hypothetical protein
MVADSPVASAHSSVGQRSKNEECVVAEGKMKKGTSSTAHKQEVKRRCRRRITIISFDCVNGPPIE